MTTPDLEGRIRSWYADEIGEAESAPASLYDFAAAVPHAAPDRHGLLGRRFILLAAAALLVGALGAAIALGSGTVKLPSLLPSPSEAVDASTEATPSVSAEPTPEEPLGLVAYLVDVTLVPGEGDCTEVLVRACSVSRIWVANSDGSDARELMPGEPWSQGLIAWSPDGTRLLYSDHLGNLALTDVEGSEPQLIPGPSQCPVENCPSIEGLAFSPDGTRLAYAAAKGDEAASSVILILDLGSGEITELESTQSDAVIPCTTAASEGNNESPRWSPDGTQLVFARQGIGPLRNGGCQSTLFVVNADGSDVRQLVPAEMNALIPSWSPDGARIVFHSSTYLPGYPQDDTAMTVDISSVRADGNDLRKLTSDGASAWPRWTRDRRIVFQKWIDMELGTYRSGSWMLTEVVRRDLTIRASRH